MPCDGCITVLLDIEQYQNLIGGNKSIAVLLEMSGGEDIEFEPTRISPNFPAAELN